MPTSTDASHASGYACNVPAMRGNGRTYGLTENQLLLRNEKANSVTRAGGYGDLGLVEVVDGFASLAWSTP